MTSSIRDRVSERDVPARRAVELVTPGPLGPAQARWNDYRGTAAADDAIALLGSRSLYEMASLDRSRWTIVGIEASLLTSSEQVVVYAVDRSVEPDGRDECHPESWG